MNDITLLGTFIYTRETLIEALNLYFSFDPSNSRNRRNFNYLLSKSPSHVLNNQRVYIACQLIDTANQLAAECKHPIFNFFTRVAESLSDNSNTDKEQPTVQTLNSQEFSFLSQFYDFVEQLDFLSHDEWVELQTFWEYEYNTEREFKFDLSQLISSEEIKENHLNVELQLQQQLINNQPMTNRPQPQRQPITTNQELVIADTSILDALVEDLANRVLERVLLKIQSSSSQHLESEELVFSSIL